MKQKILYILVMITALIGGNGDAWAQSDVPGYNRTTSSSITYSQSGDGLNSIIDKNFMLSTANTLSNTTDNVNFSIVDISFYRGSLYIYGNETKTLTWNANYFYVTLNGFEIKSRCSVGGNFGKGKIKIAGGGKEASHKVYTLLTDDYKTLSISDFTIGPDKNITITTYDDYGAEHFINSLKFTYKISKYELITTALDEATDYADSKSSSIDESIRDYLTTARSNAITFKDACAFPNSYWNGSSVGKTPTDVTTTAEKLNAITNYLIARTNANQFEINMVPNAVYDWLHTYDQYNPNNNADDANTINTKTHDIKAAINAANATTSAYQSALTTIASAENSFDKTNDQGQETLTADIVNAKAQLELATDENGINTALANIKKFDAFTFNPDVPSKIEEGNTLDNPASAQQGNVITYESSDNTIIEIDGTTLKALKPGTVTITATTKTGDKYYGYTTTKEFTVTPKALILYPGEKCTIVPNIVYPEITLERSFSAKTHYTLTLPFDSNISDIDGDYAAQLALVTYNKADGYTLYFQKVAEGDMIANQPYIVYAENGFKKSLKWVNITVAETIEAKGVSNDRTQGWTMQGNYTPGLSMSGKYGIAGGEFCLGTEKSSINAYTAYFTFLGTENVRTRVAVMDEGGNTTYIGELKDLDGNAAEEGIFGLDGIQQNQLRKGINIVRMKDGKVRKILK